MVRVFLIGYMGAGKTTVGKALAEEMDLCFIDLDHYIENRYHKSVRELFSEKGEEGFRAIEQKILVEVSAFEDVVISTGGGVPCFFDNMRYMNQRGTTIYLKASPEELASRIEPNKHTRPVLGGRSGDALIQFIRQSLQKRNPYYEQAAYTYNAENLQTRKEVRIVVNDLISLLGE